jgi:hypothetical protein
MPEYKVMVDDNFHYMEEDERREHGTFPTLDEAVTACRKLVDEALLDEYKPDITAAELYDRYVSFGDDPFIVAPERAAEGLRPRARSDPECRGPDWMVAAVSRQVSHAALSSHRPPLHPPRRAEERVKCRAAIQGCRLRPLRRPPASSPA